MNCMLEGFKYPQGVTHLRNCGCASATLRIKWTTEGPELWEKVVQFRAEIINVETQGRPSKSQIIEPLGISAIWTLSREPRARKRLQN